MWDVIKTVISKRPMACLGGVAGMLAAILFIMVGFWQTLLIIALAMAGVVLGARLDRVAGVKEKFSRWLPVVPGDEDDF